MQIKTALPLVSNQHPHTVEWSVYVDGATFGGNPSHLGCGAFTVWRNSDLYFGSVSPLFGATNNRAEFFALSKALVWLEAYGMQEVPVYTDSDILAKWCNHNAKLTNPHLVALTTKLKPLLDSTRSSVTWVPRNTRELAFTDYLASFGEGGKRLVFDTRTSHGKLIAGYYI